MNFPLIWKLSMFIWCNIIIFLCLTYVFITVFVSPYGAKSASHSNFFNKFITPNQDKNNTPLKRNTNVEEADISYSRSDVFKDEFDERIDTLKDELRNIYEDSLSDLPDELEDKFFTYNEEEEYVPDLYDGESGVEIITDAYEKRIEDRLS